jgi:hypothetical protein
VEGSEGRLEEQGVALASFGQKEGMQGGRHREDQVEVGHGEKIAGLGFHPACLLQTLALGAMAVPAGVVEGFLSPTVIAHLEVAAQLRRSTSHDVLDSTTVAS